MDNSVNITDSMTHHERRMSRNLLCGYIANSKSDLDIKVIIQKPIFLLRLKVWNLHLSTY